MSREHEKVYYRNPTRTWKNTYGMGHRAWKSTTDLWVYQELVYQVRPGLVIETGTAEGGSDYYLASLLDLPGRGRVLTSTSRTLAGGRSTHASSTYSGPLYTQRSWPERRRPPLGSSGYAATRLRLQP